jgi:hypothetical protein
MDITGQARANQRKPTGQGGTKIMPFPATPAQAAPAATPAQAVAPTQAAPAQAAPAQAAPAQAAQPVDTSRDFSWKNAGKAIGNVVQGVKNTAGAIGDAATGAYDAVTGAATDAATGYNAAQTPVAATAAKPAATAAKPAATAPSGAARKPDPQILAMQQELIKRGYPLKADGIMGPKTQAAHDYEMQASGMQSQGASIQADTAAGVATDKANYDAKVGTVNKLFGKQAPAPAPATSATSTTPAAPGFPGAKKTGQAVQDALPTSFASLEEHVSFGYDQELARIISLTRR